MHKHWFGKHYEYSIATALFMVPNCPDIHGTLHKSNTFHFTSLSRHKASNTACIQQLQQHQVRILLQQQQVMESLAGQTSLNVTLNSKS